METCIQITTVGQISMRTASYITYHDWYWCRIQETPLEFLAENLPIMNERDCWKFNNKMIATEAICIETKLKYVSQYISYHAIIL